MALTEPEAGSDLQNVQLKATLGADGVWRLSGVKRFITNGCGQVSLVLARSEEGTTDARGLSMFLYERDEHMKIRRLEDKLGIHGSPTCELQFDEAPALLVGERRRGLTTYVMSLMNGARIAIAAQAQGIAEAAYRAASKYADERVQFGGPIRELTAVAAMLADMKVALEASRALLYETAMIVDLQGRPRAARRAASVGRARGRRRRRAQGAARRAQDDTRLAALYTPLAKACATEMANRVAYDSLQIHGGSGYMRDFAVERHARDARITNIYEGTTQLQVVAALGGVLSGTLAARLDEYDAADLGATPELLARVRAARERWAPPWPTCARSTTPPSGTSTAAAWSRPPSTSSAPTCCCAPPSTTLASCSWRATSSSRWACASRARPRPCSKARRPRSTPCRRSGATSELAAASQVRPGRRPRPSPAAG